METKTIPFEIKADSEGVVEGYASRFGEVDRGGDTIEAGAYAKSLASGRKVKMLWQHDPGQPIGVWDEAKEDSTGLWVKGRILKEVERGRETIALIKEGAIDGLSIGYRTLKSKSGEGGSRLLQELDLWEISMVTFPMQESARIDAMKAAEEFERGNTALLKRMVEDGLREAGFSINQAKAASSAAVGKLVSVREAGSGLGELAQYMRQFQTGQGE